MGAVSRSIAEGQYHLASARALADGQPRPARRPSCFFDPRHGMSVRDVLWTPPGAARPAQCRPAPTTHARWSRESSLTCGRWKCAGHRSVHVNAGFAPAYWGGYGLLPGMFTGFLLGEALSSGFGYPGGYFGDPGGYGDGDYGGNFGDGDSGGGGDFGGGDFGGGGGIRRRLRRAAEDFGGGGFS